MKISKKICLAVNKFIKEDQLPHLLFYGPPGTGKTSTILACAKQIYSPQQFNSMVSLKYTQCLLKYFFQIKFLENIYKSINFLINSKVLELNASDDRGIGIVREQILSFASTKTIFKAGFKLIILDEADAMTNDAQNALRRSK